MTYPETIPDVVEVEYLGGFRLRLEFDDGLVRELDFEGLLPGDVFEPLHDPEFFARAFVDPELKTLTWPGELDLDPVVLHGDEQPVGEPMFRVVSEAARPAA
ncbi:MAG TPA: DUF2442 domain-containing protein [Solirubrobacterales bacterium]|nr:DUF2442 domain-containing protein [Solirubrobacterales bacterium]